MSDANGALQHRQEIANENGEVRGSYGYTDSNGTYRRVDYVANSREGFRVRIDSNEPGIIKQNINPNILYA